MLDGVAPDGIRGVGEDRTQVSGDMVHTWK